MIKNNDHENFKTMTVRNLENCRLSIETLLFHIFIFSFAEIFLIFFTTIVNAQVNTFPFACFKLV